MRRALTLIELILTMVIIGIVFTVIPRLIHSMNQTSQTAIQEEAMYNAMTLMGAIINLPWDSNNTEHDQILQVNNGNSAYTCNTASGYRIGGFIGGRNCIEPGGVDYNSTLIGKEGTEFNDLDDYHDANITADKNCSSVLKKGLYGMSTTVVYTDDPSSAGTVALNLAPKSSNQTSNTKRVIVKVGYGSDSQHSGCITALEYHAFNIGQIQINKRVW